MLTQTEQKPPDGYFNCPRVRCFPPIVKAASLRHDGYATSLGGRRASLHSFNDFLFSIGFQTKVGGLWQPTDKAKGYFKFHDVERSNKTGSAQQLRWNASVIAILREAIAKNIIPFKSQKGE